MQYFLSLFERYLDTGMRYAFSTAAVSYGIQERVLHLLKFITLKAGIDRRCTSVFEEDET